jgi:hypothetical protein
MAEATDEHGGQDAGLEGQVGQGGGDQPMEQSYTYEGQPYVATTRRSKVVGFVGAKPSSLASLTTGKRYLSDPLTPLTPRPNVRKPLIDNVMIRLLLSVRHQSPNFAGYKRMKTPPHTKSCWC